MKISEKLPKFIDKNALFIVISNQNGKIFIANNEEINIVKDFFIEKPNFFARAGMFFKKKGRGRPVGASAVKENLKDNLKEELIKSLDDAIKDVLSVNDNFDYVYLFSSPYIINKAKDLLENKYKLKINKIINGNFIKYHPFKLIEKSIQ